MPFPYLADRFALRLRTRAQRGVVPKNLVLWSFGAVYVGPPVSGGRNFVPPEGGEEDEVMTIEVATAAGWSPSLETVGFVIAVTTAFFVAVQAVAVVVQALYIRAGLNQMRRASEERSRQLDQQAADSKVYFEQQAVDSKVYFEQQKVYFERQAADNKVYFERQAAESERRHQEMMQSLADQRRALEALIERTAPSSPSPPLVVLG